MGALYAARLALSGQDVAMLARGDRRDALRQQGITLENGATGERESISVEVVDHLAPEAIYDLVLVVLPKPALAEVLPILAAHKHSPSVMFFGNNAAGPERLIAALGPERVLLGFPGAAAIQAGDAIRFVITSRAEQPTTIGELDGQPSARISDLARVFEEAGFPAAISENMDAWLKTHVAKILPTGGALMFAGGELAQLRKNPEAIALLVRAMREGLEILRASGIPITPANHRVLLWLPEPPTRFVMRRMLGSSLMAIKIGHAAHARAELQLLADEFRALNAVSRLPTPAMDTLFGHLAADAAPGFANPV